MMNSLTMQRVMVVVICAALAAPGCASAGGTRIAAAAPSAERQITDRTVLAEYVQKLPPGTPIRVESAGGRTLRGTLMKASGQSLIVQPRTRIPEPAVEIPFSDVLRVTPESSNGNNLGKAIGIGVAAGAGAALGVFLIIVAIFAD